MSTEKAMTGRVKWFNNKSGFGFVTVVLSEDKDLVGTDIFAHHSSVVVAKEQFRYLVQGEYVEFNISDVSDTDSKHKFQTASVSGVGGGMLMCETRYEVKLTERDSDRDRDGEGDNNRKSRGPNWETKRPNRSNNMNRSQTNNDTQTNNESQSNNETSM